VKLSELAERLGCLLEGNGEIEVTRVATLEQAGAGDLTFLANAKYLSQLSRTRASAIILAPGVEGHPCAALRTPNPYLAFARATALLHPQPRPAPGVHPTAIVARDAIIEPDVSIGPYVVIGDGARIGTRSIVHAHTVIGAGATLGPDCLVHARVSIREGVQIGARVVVQDGAVIGSDGFGFAPRGDGTYEKIQKVSTVVIEDDL
jgi:UDP-3-O-[3-hydroxymyristoyl] glucosamine N-acyltransferase